MDNDSYSAQDRALLDRALRAEREVAALRAELDEVKAQYAAGLDLRDDLRAERDEWERRYSQEYTRAAELYDKVERMRPVVEAAIHETDTEAAFGDLPAAQVHRRRAVDAYRANAAGSPLGESRSDVDQVLPEVARSVNLPSAVDWLRQARGFLARGRDALRVEGLPLMAENIDGLRIELERYVHLLEPKGPQA